MQHHCCKRRIPCEQVHWRRLDTSYLAQEVVDRIDEWRFAQHGRPQPRGEQRGIGRHWRRKHAGFFHRHFRPARRTRKCRGNGARSKVRAPLLEPYLPTLCRCVRSSLFPPRPRARSYATALKLDLLCKLGTCTARAAVLKTRGIIGAVGREQYV